MRTIKEILLSAAQPENEPMPESGPDPTGPSRREALMGTLFGAGYVGLRALATGLPAWMLLNPRRANAALQCNADKEKAQYLILGTSSLGDPLNGNVPGTYVHPDIMHAPDPLMDKTPITMSGEIVEGAAVWNNLEQATLDRTVFFHHTTLSVSHGNQPKVMKLMGAIRRQEMLVSVLAKNLAQCLGTVQREPVVVGAASPLEYLSYEGRTQPALQPIVLRDLLARPTGVLGKLQEMRDADLNRLNALYKEHGTQAQRQFLDRLALSQSEARNVSQQLLNDLASITSNTIDGQLKAAAVLIKMNVAPVVSIRMNWGGDNHNDADLRNEVAQTAAAVASINQLQARLMDYGLRDKVTFMAMNVFGRTMSIRRKGLAGRDHLASHHCTVLIGKNVRGGVIGGVEPKGQDFSAMPIDSKTGRGTADGDIRYEDTLAAVGKTIGAAVGVNPSALNDTITSGKVVTAALA
jgi:hypothetical protein